ncbi:DUF3006 domain-containing protein [Anaeromicrobium sediminis]|uniref:Uncharacterized protein n=1 Tax=Anaeromicrobium sediminis TaxID=1478221 RepID=A0A267MI76_9FIRM|nr:DUF3006 domain-containing protein [Anaeromicrobium sediminis]PAB59279.1 hypothetical protein CCE28_10460 [Anaeromicrobium sediminis]
MKIIVDRIEDNMVIGEREDREMVKINKNQINEPVKEGDVLVVKDGKFIVDEEGTNRLKEEVKNMMEDLFE